MEDLEDLVPQLLREFTRGANVSLASEAMRQLAKLPWPGNVAQLRKVLAAHWPCSDLASSGWTNCPRSALH
ncbi:AAA-type ATPase lid domain-containing protein [Mycobacterium tilburgii]